MVGIEDETSVDILIHKYNLCSYAPGHGFVLLIVFCLFNTPAAAAAAFALTRYHFCAEFPYHNPILFWYRIFPYLFTLSYTYTHTHSQSFAHSLIIRLLLKKQDENLSGLFAFLLPFLRLILIHTFDVGKVRIKLSLFYNYSVTHVLYDDCLLKTGEAN